jgi:hypothetical protein
LTNVSLKLYSVDFIDFEKLVTDFFRHVRILRIIVWNNRYVTTLEYLDADRWEQLISTHLLNLCIFDLQHRYEMFDYNSIGQVYTSRVNKIQFIILD